MKFDIADLERLASTLESNSAVAEALASKHAKAREMDDSAKQTTRAENGRKYAAVCREAARRLRIRQTRKGFTPPTWEETFDYAKERHPLWPAADVLAWWNHFESNGWKVGGKSTMQNWQRAADNGFLRWKSENPEKARASYSAPAGQRAKGDPEGWADFLKSLSRKYKEYRFEAEWVRSDFLKAQRAAK